MALTPFSFAVPFAFGGPSFGPTSRELRAMDRAFDGWASALMPTFELPMQGPSTAMDIVESDSAFTVTADAPGFDPQDVKIELKDGRITISGRKDEEKRQEKDGKVVRRERTSASFCRSFAVPDNIREADISASLDKGVLTVTLPKAEPAPKPEPRRIAVQTVEAPDAHAQAPAAPGEAGEGQEAPAAADAAQE